MDRRLSIMRKNLLFVTEAALEHPEAVPLSDIDRARVNGVFKTGMDLRPYLQQRYTVTYLTPFDYPDEGRSMAGAMWRGDTRCSAPVQSTIALVRPTATDMARRFDAARPDFVHVMTEGPLGLEALRTARRRGVPVSTAFLTKWHEYVHAPSFHLPGVPTKLAEVAVKKVLTAFHGAADATMVSTADVKAELVSWGMKPEKIFLVSRGVDTAVFHPYPAAESPVPEPYVVYVGRLVSEKRVDRFCALETPGLRKVVVGAGDLAAELKEKYPDVLFAGFAEGENLARYFSAATLSVLPSDNETFGRTVLESLACGTPVVSLDRGGHQAILRAARGLGTMEPNLQQAFDVARRDPGQFMPPAEMANYMKRTRPWKDVADAFSVMLSGAAKHAARRGGNAPLLAGA